MRVRIQQRVRALAAALVPAGTALALFTMSPMGAELAMADEPTAAQFSSGSILGGATSNGWPVVVELTRNGRMIKHAVAALSADCTQGGRFIYPSEWAFLRISRSGTFRTSWEDTDVYDGTQVHLTETFTGKFNRARTRLTATMRASTTFRMPDGTEDVCDTGALKITARR